MKLAIVGSRNFNNYEQLKAIVWEFFKIRKGNIPQDIIISGGAKGADYLAKKYTEEYKIKYKEFPANWTKYGKAAGPIRNKQIVDACDVVLAFLEENSKGTANTVKLAKEAKKPTFIIYI
jgi:predicted Rossmann fold nucleotide-binding protein DprA/Smf involved in DNA uptake